MPRVTIEFKGNVVNVTKSIDKVLSKFGDLATKGGGSADKLDKRFDRLQKKLRGGFDKMGRKALRFTAVLGGLVTGGGVAVLTKRAIELETALANVGTLLGKSLPLLSDYEKGIKEISKSTSKSLVDLTAGLYDTISAGISSTTDAGVALEFLNQAQKAAVAGLSTTQEAVKAGAIALNVFTQEGLTAAQIFQQFFLTVKNGVLTFQELATSFGNVATSAEAAGATFNETLAAVATITKGGKGAAEATTALRSLFDSLAAPTIRARNKIDALSKATGKNIQIGKEALKSQGLAKVLKNVTDAAGGNLELLRKLIPSTEALQAAQILAKDSGKAFADVLKQMNAAGSEFEEAFKLQSETISFAFGRLRNAFDRLASDVVSKFQPQIKEGIDGITDSVNEIDDDSIGLAIEGITSAVGGLVKAIKFLIDVARDAGEELANLFDVAPSLASQQPKATRKIRLSRGFRATRGGSASSSREAATEAKSETDAARLAELAAKKKAAEADKLRKKIGQKGDPAAAQRDEAIDEELAMQLELDKIRTQSFTDAEKIKLGAVDRYTDRLEEAGKQREENEKKFGKDREEREKQAAEAAQARAAEALAIDQNRAALAVNFITSIADGLDGIFNFVGGMIDQAIGAAIEAGDILTASLLAVGGVALNKIKGAIDFAGATKPGEFKGVLTDKLDEAKQFVDNLVANLPVLFDALGPFIDEAAQKIIESLPKIVDAFVEGMPKVVEALARNVGPMIDAIVAETPRIIDGIVAQLPTLIKAFLSEVVPRIPDMTLAIVDGFIKGFVDRQDEFVEALVEGLGKAFEKLVDKFNPISTDDGGGINRKLFDTVGLSKIPGAEEAADFLDSLNPLGWLHKGGVAGDMQRFAEGGIAQHTNVPTLLERGEGIIRARRTQEIGGSRAIRDLNEGRATIAPAGAGAAAPVVNINVDGRSDVGALFATLIERAFTMTARSQGANVRTAAQVVNQQFPGLPRVQNLI